MAFYAVGVSAAVNIVIGYQVVYTICVATRAMQDTLWGEPEQSELTVAMPAFRFYRCTRKRYTKGAGIVWYSHEWH